MKRRGSRDASAPLSQVNTEPAEPALVRTVRLLDAIMRPWTRRDWQDQHKIPQTGGAIFVVNHISNADPLAVGQFLAFSGRWPRFLAKSSLFDVAIVGRLLRACGQIPVQRQSPAAADALAAAVRAVELDDLRSHEVTSPILIEATDRIMDAITSLVADLRGGVPPSQRFDPRARRDEPRDWDNP